MVYSLIRVLIQWLGLTGWLDDHLAERAVALAVGAGVLPAPMTVCAGVSSIRRPMLWPADGAPAKALQTTRVPFDEFERRRHCE